LPLPQGTKFCSSFPRAGFLIFLLARNLNDSNVDPAPHFIMAAACAGAGAFAYMRLNNPMAAAIAAGIAAGYYASGYLLNKGDTRMGYDLASVTSIALMAAVGPVR
jgi:hypothetical protein